jgi:hypothetical protein
MVAEFFAGVNCLNKLLLVVGGALLRRAAHRLTERCFLPLYSARQFCYSTDSIRPALGTAGIGAHGYRISSRLALWPAQWGYAAQVHHHQLLPRQPGLSRQCAMYSLINTQ